jgi:hypothetical protein
MCLHMPQIVLATGLDAQNNVISLYTGASEAAALDAVDAAGKADSIVIGHVYDNPPANTTLRYPAATAAAGAS